MSTVFGNIGLQGHAVGSFSLKPSGFEWRDKNSALTEFPKADIKSLSWNMYGSRGYLKVAFNNGDWTRFDGFARADYADLDAYSAKNYQMVIAKETVSSEGASFGTLTLRDKTIVLSSVSSDKTVFEIKVDNAAQCVVPKNAPNDLELQFNEGSAEKEEECLSSITFHFPVVDTEAEGGSAEDPTLAMQFQEEVLKTGAIKSVKGDVICEFSKEIGNFVSPRGKYGMQLTSTFLHMVGAQYTYKIKYSDITSLFLLDKPDGLRVAFVICLAMPIRQGAQKYQYLVLDTHKMEHTVQLNITQEEIDANESFRGNLQPEMTLALSSVIAKLFKVLTETSVYVPKTFKSYRDDFCIRCSHKTQDGLLYPLAKNIIFINKPTIVLSYDEIEHVEFQRYLPEEHSATKNFDVLISVKTSSQQGVNGKEVSYQFTSIDRSEYNTLFDFFDTRKIPIKNPQKGLPQAGGKRGKMAGAFAGMDGGESGGDEEDSEDDGDYKAGESEHSGDSDDSGSDDSEGGGGGGGGSDDEAPRPKKEKKERAPKADRGSDKPKKEKATKEKAPKGEGKGAKRPRAKKDPNAPKRALAAYMFFAKAIRSSVVAETPGLKPTEIMKIIGEKWKAATAEEKAPFEEQQNADKDRYKYEMDAYKKKRAAEGADLDLSDESDLDGGAGGGDDPMEE